MSLLDAANHDGRIRERLAAGQRYALSLDPAVV
jgi:hypothetical protein